MKRLALAAVLALAACASSSSSLPPQHVALTPGATMVVTPQTYDALRGGPCRLSADGILWYRVNGPHFPPMSVAYAACDAPSALLADGAPALPAWSRPSGSTQAIFVPASSAMRYLANSPAAIHAVAAARNVPLTWLVTGKQYFAAGGAPFDAYHAQGGDDVETSLGLTVPAQGLYPWYSPAVAVLGVDGERDIAGALAIGDRAFWGITWNSHGVDGTADMGAPWGTYCADITSYKRPDPAGNCALLSFEWTARDLTRAYYSGREDAYSTDPEDLLQRAGFSPAAAANYVRAVVDAYAAAGASTPLVFVSHEEADEFATNAAADFGIMDAIYDEAVRDGMQVHTMRDAIAPAAAFSDRPRAVAFPFIPGGGAFLPAPMLPATIDFHDRAAGMTFEAGRALPLRIFEFADAVHSSFNLPLPQVQAADMPRLTAAAYASGTLTFHFVAPRALHAGIAIWGDPVALGLSGPGIVPAGHAGAVAVFDLPAGASDQSIGCAACGSTTFDYPL